MAIVHFVNYKRGTQSRAAMRGVMLYVMQEKKSAWEGEPLVSGINCQPQSAYDDFLNTKLLYHKDGGVMFYHMVQEFSEGCRGRSPTGPRSRAAAGGVLRRLRGAGLHPRRPRAYPLPLHHQLRQLRYRQKAAHGEGTTARVDAAQ